MSLHLSQLKTTLLSVPVLSSVCNATASLLTFEKSTNHNESVACLAYSLPPLKSPIQSQQWLPCVSVGIVVSICIHGFDRIFQTLGFLYS